MLTTNMLTLNLSGNMTESSREKNSGITTVSHSKYLPSIVRMFYWLEFKNITIVKWSRNGDFNFTVLTTGCT